MAKNTYPRSASLLEAKFNFSSRLEGNRFSVRFV